MDAQKANTRRVAKNTLMLYVRMLFGMLVSLYTSRAILEALGVEGYGVYEVVAGFVGFFSIISSSLSSAVSRFITFELGKNDPDRLKQVFSTSLYIHVLLALLVVLVAETVGLWYVNYKIVLPEGSLVAANWIFQVSILTFVTSIMSVPYIATIVAHERMGVFAYMGILNIVLKLAIVLFLVYVEVPFDKLITYAVLLAVVGLSLQYLYLRYCWRHFAECRSVRIVYDRTIWTQICSFAGWNFIGCSASIMRGQGINLLLNAFFGVVVNSARGIAGTINGACVSFSSTFTMALNPQITKNYSAGNMAYAFSLVERGSRFSFYIVMILMIPVLLETEFILNIWLGRHIDHLIVFTRLTLLLSMIEVLSNTLITLQLATGNIRNYQLAVGGALLMEFPLSYIALKCGASPEFVYVVAIFIAFVCLAFRLVFLNKMTGLSIRGFFKDVCLRVCLVFVPSFILPLLLLLSISTSWGRFLSVSIVSVLSSCCCVYYIGCSIAEREFIRSSVVSFKSKLVNRDEKN